MYLTEQKLDSAVAQGSAPVWAARHREDAHLIGQRVYPRSGSALHRPRKGLWNRIVDYNGTMLLLYEKLGWVRNLKIAPQFA